MTKKYGPKDELSIKNVKFGKEDISNKMPMIDVEKRITELNQKILNKP